MKENQKWKIIFAFQLVAAFFTVSFVSAQDEESEQASPPAEQIQEDLTQENSAPSDSYETPSNPSDSQEWAPTPETDETSTEQ